MARFHYAGFANTAGIYIIFNNQNWKVYIGSCRRFKERWTGHIRQLRTQKHHNSYLQASYNKYGDDAFEFFVVQAMPDASRDERLAAETALISLHVAGSLCYNLRKDATSSEGSEGYARKTRGPHSAETRQKISQSHKGKTVSPELRQQISQALIGRVGANKGIKFTEEWKQKLRAAKLGKKQDPTVVAKRAAANTGKKRTKETCERISQALRRK